ncbi:8229_t:CDS:2 [Funneliformis caledonium]|uniref:8229_t:CDS:1 n=1 Tax=Funneliformis caledonium TaxID=1117310 RepID=A0A9N8Z9R6_9GLOM|nr:8229_t:CDS:2 [Funneliformis caledonium]
MHSLTSKKVYAETSSSLFTSEDMKALKVNFKPPLAEMMLYLMLKLPAFRKNMKNVFSPTLSIKHLDYQISI